MNIAFRVKCKRCGEYWWAIIGENPCYDTCPNCKTENKISVEVKTEIAEWIKETGK